MAVTIKVILVTLMLTTTQGQSQTVDIHCRRLWTFHEHTGTCMRFFETQVTYKRARESCLSYAGKPSGEQKGWLVAIYDATTDTFVQSLVKADQRAFIGLSKKGDKWVWDVPDPLKSSSNYRRWAGGNPVTGYWNSYVAITQNGWKTVTYLRRYGFVCQMFPDLQAPSMTCPPSEQGKPLMPIECRVTPRKSYGYLESIRIYNDVGSTALFCQLKPKSCVSYNHLSQTEAKMYMESSMWKASVTEKTLTSRDNNGVRWSCSAEFEKTPTSFLKTSCTMQTFVIPKNMECNQKVSARDGVSITCNVDGVFPRASSAWTHIINDTETHQLHSYQNHKTYNNDDGQEMFISVFFSGQIATSGQHLLEITVYPDVQFNHEEARHKASIHRTVEFTISPPEQFPVFSTENDMEVTQGHLTVEEGQAVTVICEVHGGSPHVSQTLIQCDGNNLRDSSGRLSWTKRGAKVSVKLVVTKHMDQKVCTCKARHVSKAYHKSASLTLNVLHAVAIESFKVNRASPNEIDVSFGERANFQCRAKGNPAPELHLYKYDGYSMTELEPTKFTKTSISFHIAKSSCDASGLYMCSAKNSLNSEPIERQVSLRVKCPPQSCSKRLGYGEVKILPGKELNFKLCIFAYPYPHSDIRVSIFKNNIFRNLNKETYIANYTNTNNLKTKGSVAVHMTPSVTQPGNYTIDLYQLSRWNRVHFRLVSYQRPSCPGYLNISLVGSRFVVLQWQPAFDLDLPQTFTLTMSDKDGVMNKKDTEDNGEATMILYNSTGLDPHSTYIVKLDVRNEQGLTKCPHLTVNVTTKAIPMSDRNSDDRSVGAVVSAVVAIIVILVIIAVIVIVFVRRERCDITEETAGQRMPDKAHGRKSIHDREAKGKCLQNVDKVYATVNKPNKTVVPKSENLYNNEIPLEVHGIRNKPCAISTENAPDNKANTIGDRALFANTGRPCSQSKEVSDRVFSGEIAAKDDNKKSLRHKKSKVKKSDEILEEETNRNTRAHNVQISNNRQNKELVYVEVEVIPLKDKKLVKPRETLESVAYASLNFQSVA
ncbi:sidestep protein [Elysia marginata]|uniref:Sidestep protein n=1 Tax=Elysia marginata TaxID=1093978 RepID=A0AAV4FLP8_9GAST|nr:sidestep protein [Elysia marginata]